LKPSAKNLSIGQISSLTISLSWTGEKHLKSCSVFERMPSVKIRFCMLRTSTEKCQSLTNPAIYPVIHWY